MTSLIIVPMIFVVSALTHGVVIALAYKYNLAIDIVNPNSKSENRKNHKSHKISTPRAGGLGIVLGYLLGAYFFGFEFYFVLIALLVFAIGFYEDIKHGVSPKLRLICIALSTCFVFIGSSDAIITNIGFSFPLFIAIPFTIFAVTGLTNSINIIDGVNGLSSAILIIALSFLAGFAFVYNDTLVLNICLAMGASLLGFFVWNFPKGRIFLGDGGAYFSGFTMAILSIIIVNRNEAISPWFPVIIFAYPIVDTLFSIYRRKFISKKSSLAADNLHLHTLILKRVSRKNHKVLMYIIPTVLVFDMVATYLYANTAALVLLFVCFILTYIYFYDAIVNFSGKKSFARRLKKINGKVL
jgi:UDP-N-acetylmuramyl pentapeptide phosphotransferase/UDP-N-acetylglucosamine-1-phosphate transferase